MCKTEKKKEYNNKGSTMDSTKIVKVDILHELLTLYYDLCIGQRTIGLAYT